MASPTSGIHQADPSMAARGPQDTSPANRTAARGLGDHQADSMHSASTNSSSGGVTGFVTWVKDLAVSFFSWVCSCFSSRSVDSTPPEDALPPNSTAVETALASIVAHQTAFDGAETDLDRLTAIDQLFKIARPEEAEDQDWAQVEEARAGALKEMYQALPESIRSGEGKLEHRIWQKHSEQVGHEIHEADHGSKELDRNPTASWVQAAVRSMIDETPTMQIALRMAAITSESTSNATKMQAFLSMIDDVEASEADGTTDEALLEATQKAYQALPEEIRQAVAEALPGDDDANKAKAQGEEIRTNGDFRAAFERLLAGLAETRLVDGIQAVQNEESGEKGRLQALRALLDLEPTELDSISAEQIKAELAYAPRWLEGAIIGRLSEHDAHIVGKFAKSPQDATVKAAVQARIDAI